MVRISEPLLSKHIFHINFIIKHIHISFSHTYFQNYQKIYSVSNFVLSHIYTVCVRVCVCIHIKTHIPTSSFFFPLPSLPPSRRFLGSYLCDHNLTPITSVTYFNKWNCVQIQYDVFKKTVLQNFNLKSWIFPELFYQCDFESHMLIDINKNKCELWHVTKI
jgi:hypothetical protein